MTQRDDLTSSMREITTIGCKDFAKDAWAAGDEKRKR